MGPGGARAGRQALTPQGHSPSRGLVGPRRVAAVSAARAKVAREQYLSSVPVRVERAVPWRTVEQAELAKGARALQTHQNVSPEASLPLAGARGQPLGAPPCTRWDQHGADWCDLPCGARRGIRGFPPAPRVPAGSQSRLRPAFTATVPLERSNNCSHEVRFLEFRAAADDLWIDFSN